MNNKYRVKFPIFCIGDSHTCFFAGINKTQSAWPRKFHNFLPFFKAFNLGPVLAYNLVSLNTKTKGREKLFKLLTKEVPKGSSVMLCFGEIDCRAHLLKQSLIQKRSIKVIVSECVNRYFSVIQEVRKLGYKVLVWNVIPSTRLNNTNKDFPTFGSCRERNVVVSLFNKNLRAKCKKNKIPFISVYDFFINKNGLTKMSYYMDEVHLSQKAMPVVLKVSATELGKDFKLSAYQFLKYKIANLFVNSVNTVRKLKASLH